MKEKDVTIYEVTFSGIIPELALDWSDHVIIVYLCYLLLQSLPNQSICQRPYSCCTFMAESDIFIE